MTASAQHFTSPPQGILTPAMRSFYETYGFLILDNFISSKSCRSLIQHTKTLINNADPSKILRFFLEEDQPYLLEMIHASCRKFCFFYDTTLQTFQKMSSFESVAYLNKISHALHDLDPLFSQFSRQPRIENLIKSLGMQVPLLIQSMFLFKQPRTSQSVDCHQDASFLYTSPQTLVGLWFALEDAMVENGCLWVYPGSHKHNLKKRYIRLPNGTLKIETLDPTPWPDQHCIALRVRKGALILLHGLLVHFSRPNQSRSSRNAYSLHIIDGKSSYDTANWLQRPFDHKFKGF